MMTTNIELIVTDDLDVNDRVDVDLDSLEAWKVGEGKPYHGRAVQPFMAGERAVYEPVTQVLYRPIV